jgi:hypothetical protein
MKRQVVTRALLAGLTALLIAVPAQASLNKSIKIGDGESSDGESSVNGSITIGEGATVSGDVTTVNGKIRIEAGAVVGDAGTVNGGLRIADRVQANSLSTVNGSIRVGKDAVVDGEITAVNGGIAVEGGSKVANDVENVNGDIELRGSEIGGTLTTVSGDVELVEGAVLRGGLVVRKPDGWGWKDNRKPRIVIGPGSRVEGVILLEREVKLFISEAAEVGGVEGEMSLDDAVRFSGKRP